MYFRKRLEYFRQRQLCKFEHLGWQSFVLIYQISLLFQSTLLFSDLRNKLNRNLFDFGVQEIADLLVKSLVELKKLYFRVFQRSLRIDVLSILQEIRLPHEVQLFKATLSELKVYVLNLLYFLIVLHLIRVVLVVEDSHDLATYSPEQILILDQLVWRALVIGAPVLVESMPICKIVEVVCAALLIWMPFYGLQVQIFLEPFEYLDLKELVVLLKIALLLLDALNRARCRFIVHTAALAAHSWTVLPLTTIGSTSHGARWMLLHVDEQLVQKGIQSFQLHAFADQSWSPEGLFYIHLKQVLEL